MKQKVPQSQINEIVDLFVVLLSSGYKSSDTIFRKCYRLDTETLISRVKNEGMPFLTKCLPELGKAFDKGLVEGSFCCPRTFAKSFKNRSIPAFMGECFNEVFADNGVLRPDPPYEVVKFIRQVLFFAYKLELPYSPEKENNVINNFINNEVSLSVMEIPDSDLEIAQGITMTVFRDFDPKDISPRHGPGAVATGEKLDNKWNFSRLYNAIHQQYPYYNYFMVGGRRELIDRLAWYKSLQRLESGRAKVVLVPKDSRGPRLISAEPLEYMWLQQGLGRKIMSHLEEFYLTKGHINFSSQEVNQRIAERSSLDGSFATLDLKDASDLVHVDLVRKVFAKTPQLLQCLLALRTTETTLPDGRVIKLKKFAPMGSALCFPIEAYIFWVLCVSAIRRASRVPLREVKQAVYVYGDDIIIPIEYVDVCVQELERFGLKVNTDKSCTQGNFRESCGFDAYKGEKVTPLRLRKPWTGRRTDAAFLSSYVSLGNSFIQDGNVQMGEHILHKVERIFGLLPWGTERASYLCRIRSDYFDCLAHNALRHECKKDGRLFRTKVKSLTIKSKKVNVSLDGWPRVLRGLTQDLYEDPSVMSIPRSTQIKRGWNAIA